MPQKQQTPAVPPAKKPRLSAAAAWAQQQQQNGEVYDEDWVPPVDQAGDGRSDLNTKFGY